MSLNKISPVIVETHLFVKILSLSKSRADKSLIIVYKVYNLPILHPILQKKKFCYSVEGENLALSSDGDYTSLLQNVTC